MKTIVLTFLLIVCVLGQDRYDKYNTWNSYVTSTAVTGDVTAPTVPSSIQFDSLGTDSTEWLATGWPDESGTTNWLAFKTSAMTVASDTSGADSLFYAADSITGSKHWKHGLSDNGTVYYMLVQYDSSSNSLVTTGSYAITNWIASAPTIATIDTFGAGTDSTYVTANTWDAKTTGFWIAWDDTLISAVADSSDADSLLYHAVGDSADTFKWNHPFSSNGSFAKATIIATDGSLFEITYDSCVVNAFDAAGPTLNSFAATGVNYDSGRYEIDVDVESGAYMKVLEGSDTTEFNILAGTTAWSSLADLDTTIRFLLPDSPDTVTHYLYAKDSLQNVSSLSDSCIYIETPNADSANVFLVTSPAKDSINFVITGFSLNYLDSCRVQYKGVSYPSTRSAGTSTFAFAVADTGNYADTTIFYDAPQDTTLYFKMYSGNRNDKWTTFANSNADTVAVDSTGSDVAPPTAPTVAIARNDADSLDMTVNFNAADDIDSIFVRGDTSNPANKAAGDSIYTGVDTSDVNTKTFAHGMSASGTYYLEVFVQDSVPNVTSGFDDLAVDEWIQSAPTIADFDTMGTNDDSVSVTANTWDVDLNQFTVAIDTAKMSAASDTTGAENTALYAAADSNSIDNIAHTLSNVIDEDWLYLMIVAEDADGNDQIVIDSCQIYDTTVPSAGSYATGYQPIDSLSISSAGWAGDDDLDTYGLYAKASEDDIYTSLIAGGSDTTWTDSTLSIKNIYEDGDDTLFVEMRYYDEANNITYTRDTTVYDGSAKPDSALQIVSEPDTARSVVQRITVGLSTDSTTGNIGDSSRVILMSNIDTTTYGADTLVVKIPAQDSTFADSFVVYFKPMIESEWGVWGAGQWYGQAVPDVTPPDSADTFTVTSPAKDSINFVITDFATDLDSAMVLYKGVSYPSNRTDGTATFNFAVADTGAYADTTILYDAPQDTTLYYTMFSGDASDNWTVTPNKDTVAVDSTGGAACSTPSNGDQFDEGFLGTGYENSWTEVVSTGTVDEDFTLSGTPLTGSCTEGLNVIAAAVSDKAYIDIGTEIDEAAENFNVFFQFYIDSHTIDDYASVSIVVAADNSNGTYNYTWRAYIIEDSGFKFTVTGSAGATATVVAEDTWYSVLIHSNTTAASSYYQIDTDADPTDQAQNTFTRANYGFEYLHVGSVMGNGTGESIDIEWGYIYADKP